MEEFASMGQYSIDSAKPMDCDEFLRKSMVLAMFKTMTPRMEIAMVMRFYKDATYREIASCLCVGNERVRQIINKGIRMIRHSKFSETTRLIREQKNG